jgi:hypothetical protein
VHRARNILNSLVAEILVFEIEFSLDLVQGPLGEANPAGFGKPLQASRDVDPVAIDVFDLNNDIAQMHPDPEVNTALLGYIGVAFGRAPLDGERAFDPVNHTGELDERTSPISVTIPPG